MSPKIWPFLRFATKAGLAGGAVYVAYDQGLLSSSDKGSEALRKAKEAVPPAIDEWMKYLGWELPARPSLDFSFQDSWNFGVRKSICALSIAPTKACEYTEQGWQYLKTQFK
ncbi:MICOS complex subunit MIC13 [Protopterus annectens]|uniref:MICOS complex subunit MIC13 n=1 Tax=Protopterus annectens TaxID=7888 RepID=UPI001CFACE0B|nr:MICOS complex subunit MIC13 [Protopterus annectens]